MTSGAPKRRIPPTCWGIFDVDGHWRPNPRLKMPADEQRRQNVAAGYMTPDGRSCCFPVSLTGGKIEASSLHHDTMTATTYTPELAAKFCAAIADGGTLRSVCALKGMPSKATVFRWLGEHEEFVKMYEKATDERTDTMIDEIVDIADNCPPTKEDVQKAKLQIHARVEQAQRMKPRKYGRQLQVTGEGGGPVQAKASLDVAGLPTDVLAAIMKARDAAEPR